MKLTDITYRIGNVFRDATNFARYPFQIISQQIHNAAQNRLEQVEIPIPGQDSTRVESQTQSQQSGNSHSTLTQSVQSAQSVDGNYSATAYGLHGDSTEDVQTICRECAGRRGKYRVEELLEDRGQIRIYRGVGLRNNTPVLIQEYLLNHFNRDEVRQAQEKLERLESVSLRNTTGQDFRLITPWDLAIAPTDKRGYVITRYLPGKTLREYLKCYVAMPSQQVRRVLAQMLQTLWFLHNLPVRFTDGTVQYGLIHGNLNLDSLVIASNPQQLSGQEPQFYVYAKDLALWQIPFQPSAKSRPTALKKPVLDFDSLLPKFFQRDLSGLGAVAVCLLTGDRSDLAFQPGFDPDTEPRWQAIADNPLKKIIRRLLGLDHNPFGSAEEAYRSLLAPIAAETSQVLTTAPTEADKKLPRMGCLGLLLLGLLLGIGGWWLMRSLLGQSPISLIKPKPPTTMRSVEAIKHLPNGTINFALSAPWREVIGTRRVSYDKNLLDELSDRADLGRTRFQPRPMPESLTAVQQKLQSGELAFVLGDSVNDLSGQDLEQTTVAFDGVAVFVAFSDVYRANNIPKRLNGKLTLTQLQKIYMGDDKDYRPYFSSDQVATNVFRKTLFANDSGQDFERSREFYRLRVDVQAQPINAVFEQVLKSYEANDPHISIGFARISQIYGQCSVYPLAIADSNQTTQAFVQDNGKPIEPGLDLCNTKGGYWADADVFANGQYPFVYHLSVVYARSNPQSKQAAEAFIQILKTDEGQCLLSEAGLVPVQNVRKAGVCQGFSTR